MRRGGSPSTDAAQEAIQEKVEGQYKRQSQNHAKV